MCSWLLPCTALFFREEEKKKKKPSVDLAFGSRRFDLTRAEQRWNADTKRALRQNLQGQMHRSGPPAALIIRKCCHAAECGWELSCKPVACKRSLWTSAIKKEPRRRFRDHCVCFWAETAFIGHLRSIQSQTAQVSWHLDTPTDRTLLNKTAFLFLHRLLLISVESSQWFRQTHRWFSFSVLNYSCFPSLHHIFLKFLLIYEKFWTLKFYLSLLTPDHSSLICWEKSGLVNMVGHFGCLACKLPGR